MFSRGSNIGNAANPEGSLGSVRSRSLAKKVSSLTTSRATSELPDGAESGFVGSLGTPSLLPGRDTLKAN